MLLTTRAPPTQRAGFALDHWHAKSPNVNVERISHDSDGYEDGEFADDPRLGLRPPCGALLAGLFDGTAAHAFRVRFCSSIGRHGDLSTENDGVAWTEKDKEGGNSTPSREEYVGCGGALGS